ncbi:periplasmic binding protein-like I [Endogone sp. FLAS-F59071]|nr:periplasmic binding protein-like I [Endogone sp. FLAS-F59071]|eukprot:RUS16899.1 periplasmic binding protein-like I [Endogone sp. FLAS-F59071]
MAAPVPLLRYLLLSWLLTCLILLAVVKADISSDVIIGEAAIDIDMAPAGHSSTKTSTKSTTIIHHHTLSDTVQTTTSSSATSTFFTPFSIATTTSIPTLMATSTAAGNTTDSRISANTTSSLLPTNTTNSIFPLIPIVPPVNNSAVIFNVGLLLPDPNSEQDIVGQRITIGGIAAVQMAVNEINAQNLVPGAFEIEPPIFAVSNWVYFNVTFVPSAESNPAIEIFATADMLENLNPNAVIGDVYSGMTAYSALMTAVEAIPQCSFSSGAETLSDKSLYPYFFRTITDSAQFGVAVVDFIKDMNWTNFGLIHTEDITGSTMSSAIIKHANELNMTMVVESPIYDWEDYTVINALQMVQNTAARIIILADSNAEQQIDILTNASAMGLLSDDYVWITVNPIADPLLAAVGPSQIAQYDGVMYLDGFWNLTGIPEYDAFQTAWDEIPKENSTGMFPPDLSWNQPNAYSCMYVIALGFNQALNQYEGGRDVGLAALDNDTFDSVPLTPEAFNVEYTGPAGFMNFSSTGDLNAGYYEFFYLKNGKGERFAKMLNKDFTILRSPIYHSGTTKQPEDAPPQQILNPTWNSAPGIIIIIISVIGAALSIITMITVIMNRNEKIVKATSPLFCCLELLGLIFAYISVVLFLDIPTVASCALRLIMLSIAFVLVIGNIIAKNFRQVQNRRIYRIFNNVYAVKLFTLRDSYLLKIILSLLLIVLLPIVVWLILNPPIVIKVQMTPISFCYACASGGQVAPTNSRAHLMIDAVVVGHQADWSVLSALDITLMTFDAILLLIAVLLAFKTRNVGANWSESKQIEVISYIYTQDSKPYSVPTFHPSLSNLLLSGCMVIPTFFLPTSAYFVSFYIRICIILFAATFTLLAMFGPKIAELAMRKIRKIQKRPKSRFSTYDSNTSFSSSTELVSKEGAFSLSVEAFEGSLPVKKASKWSFFAVWELKRIIVVPTRRYFVLMDPKSSHAHTHTYVSCNTTMSTLEKSIFCVSCDNGDDYLFQVRDVLALERWAQWFNNQEPSPDRFGGQRKFSAGTIAKPPSVATIAETDTTGEAGTERTRSEIAISWAEPA